MWFNIFLGLAMYDSIKNLNKRKKTDKEIVQEIKREMSTLEPTIDYLGLEDRWEHFRYKNEDED
jgi:hypothetical protein